MTLTVGAEDLGMALRMWRAGARFTIRQMTDAVNEELPGQHRISRETIRKYEQNELPGDGADPVLLMAMAAATKHRIGELPPEVQAEVEAVMELSHRSRCTSKGYQARAQNDRSHATALHTGKAA